MKKYKSIILDTDIGVDSDDAVAIALLLNLQKQGDCKVRAITCCSTRQGAASTVKAIIKAYGEDIPIGEMAYPALKCDDENNYASAIESKYGKYDGDLESVKLIRKTLTENKEKTTIVAVGPLVNIARLLKSVNDEYSEKSGVELVKDKVDAIYIMGGAFKENYSEDFALFAEWNILQDISAAKYVVENSPVELIFVPHEVGRYVYTHIKDLDHPVYDAMRSFAISKGFSLADFKRESWDPVTAYYAVKEDIYEKSSNGEISITDEGFTVFNEKKEKGHYFIKALDDYSDITEIVNGLIGGFS